jgi:hypothetical protein
MEMEGRLERTYQRCRSEMWSKIATEMGLPWRVVEDKTWDLGKKKVVKRC